MDAETSILQSLYAFPYLTVKQITRLLYSPGSKRSGVNPKMKTLFESELVMRLPMYSQSTAKEYVYWLGTKGRNKLRKIGYDFTNWREPAKMADFISSPHFRHAMITTDFLIEATLLPNVETKAVMHDFTLKRLRNAQVIPDGWIHFFTDKDIYLWLEIDMGTEKRDRIQDKVWTIIDYIKTNGYQRDYQTPTPVIVFYCLGEHRRDELVTWIEHKLTAMYEVKKARWFRVGSPALSTDLFFQEVWHVPNCHGGRNLVSLLDS